LTLSLLSASDILDYNHTDETKASSKNNLNKQDAAGKLAV